MKKKKKQMSQSEKDTRRKRRGFLFCLIFFPILALAGTGVGIYFGVKSCHKGPEEKLEIFDIQTEEGKVVLKGFKEGVSPDDIKKVLGDTLTIPKEVQVIGENAFYREETSTIPEGITKLSWGEAKISSIGSNAFSNAPFNQAITIGQTVGSVGQEAFSGSSITSLTLKNKDIVLGTDAFKNCTSLNEIHFEDFGSDIPTWTDHIFDNESSEGAGSIYIQNSIDAPEWKEYLTGTQGFNIDNDQHWKLVPIEKEIFDIRDNVLYGFAEYVTKEDIHKFFPDKILKIPNGVTSIHDEAFYNINESTIPQEFIDDVSFPKSLTSIEANAFNKAPFKKAITISDGITAIGTKAFCQSSIIGLTLEGTNVSIGESAFENCLSLTSIHLEKFGNEIPSSWPNNIFKGENEVSGSIYIQSNLDALQWENYLRNTQGFNIDNDQHWKLVPIDITIFDIDEDSILHGFAPYVTDKDIEDAFPDKVLAIPDNVTAIGEDAFYDGVKSTIPGGLIEDISFPKSLTNIEANAFNKAPFKKAITISDGISVIGQSAFYGSSITGLTFENKYISLDTNTFGNCTSLNEIHFEDFGSDIPTSWPAGVFAGENETSGTIYIQSNLHALSWETYLKNTQGFNIDNDQHWKLVPIEVTIFDIDEETGVLNGFLPYVKPEDIGEAFPDKILRIPPATSIADNAFYREDTTTIPSQYINDVAFPEDGLVSIGANAFRGANFEFEIKIPISVTTIGAGAFNASKIKSVELPNANIVIADATEGNGAFANCDALEEIFIDAEGWTTPKLLGTNTFNEPYQEGIIHISDPDLAAGWKTIFIDNYDFIFDNDHWKVDPDVVDTVLDIDEDGVLQGFYDWAEPADILEEFDDGNMVIPNTVTSVADDAFIKESEESPYMYESTIPDGITEITFADGIEIESIGQMAFAFNEHIQNINWESTWDSLKTIDNAAFMGCSVLSTFDGQNTLTLPDNMTKIGTGAFIGCASIEGFKFPLLADNTQIGDSPFSFSGETGGNLKVLDFSNLEIIDGSSLDDPYDSDCSMAKWMQFSNLLSGIKAQQGNECKIILPTYEGSLFADAKHAFLMADSMTEALDQEKSVFYWLAFSNLSLEDLQNLLTWDIQ